MMRVSVDWDNDDFKMLGLDEHCLPLDISPDDEIE